MAGGGAGKKKIQITRIPDKAKRRVTFSKRRMGLSKSASELDILCGSNTAIISVSEAGTIFTAGRPSLIHGLLLGGGSAGASVGGRAARVDCMGWEELATGLAALKKARLKIELQMMERRNNNNGNAAASSAAFSSEDAAAAAAAAPPPPEKPDFSSPSPLSSILEPPGVGAEEDYGFMEIQEELGGGCWSEEEKEAKYQELLALLNE